MRRIAIPPVIWIPGVLGSLYAWAQVLSTFSHPGAIGLDANAPGTDWMVFYEAARSCFDGSLASIFDGEQFTARLNAAFSGWLTAPLPYRPWVYPPSYLLVLLPFGLLPFFISYIAFQLATAAALVVALRAGSSRRRKPARDASAAVALATVLCPAAAMNVMLGQNAFLIAALLVGGLRLIPTRPVLGGLLLGCVTCKPHFFLLVPVALIAARQWRAFAGSVISAATLVVISAAVLGVDVWFRWISVSSGNISDPGSWTEFCRSWGDSVYACLRAAGISGSIAEATQALVLLLTVAVVWVVFRSRLSHGGKVAILMAGTILAAPHSSFYDAVMLVVAAAPWAAETIDGRLSLKAWIILLCLWLIPLISPPLVIVAGRFAPFAIAGFVALVIVSDPRLASRRKIEIADPDEPPYLGAPQALPSSGGAAG